MPSGLLAAHRPPFPPCLRHAWCVCREIVDWANSLSPGPLGGDGADQKLAANWVDKLTQWDGNLFIAANSDPGVWVFVCRHALN